MITIEQVVAKPRIGVRLAIYGYIVFILTVILMLVFIVLEGKTISKNEFHVQAHEVIMLGSEKAYVKGQVLQRGIDMLLVSNYWNQPSIKQTITDSYNSTEGKSNLPSALKEEFTFLNDAKNILFAAIEAIHEDEIEDRISQTIINSIYEYHDHKVIPKYSTDEDNQQPTKTILMRDKTSSIYFHLVADTIIELYESVWKANYTTILEDSESQELLYDLRYQMEDITRLYFEWELINLDQKRKTLSELLYDQQIEQNPRIVMNYTFVLIAITILIILVGLFGLVKSFVKTVKLLTAYRHLRASESKQVADIYQNLTILYDRLLFNELRIIDSYLYDVNFKMVVGQHFSETKSQDPNLPLQLRRSRSSSTKLQHNKMIRSMVLMILILVFSTTLFILAITSTFIFLGQEQAVVDCISLYQKIDVALRAHTIDYYSRSIPDARLFAIMKQETESSNLWKQLRLKSAQTSQTLLIVLNYELKATFGEDHYRVLKKVMLEDICEMKDIAKDVVVLSKE